MRIKISALISALGLSLLLLCSCGSDEVDHHQEKYYQEAWCKEHNGRVEVVLKDRTRCDCLTATHAVEFDFGPKWAEALGQSLHYSIMTGKKAGVVLILEKPKDKKYLDRLRRIAGHYKLPVDFWFVEPGT